MRFLVSNDDGYRATGIKVLTEVLRTLGEVRVVAPDRDRSGASNSLTLDRPLRASQPSEHVYVINGTPTDCVHLALTGLFDWQPDMVISGINAGENLGDDVLYSGTVAAAMEGRFMGFPAIAVSLSGEPPRHFDTAAAVVRTLVAHIIREPLPEDAILNVNVPDLAPGEPRSFATTRLGQRHKSEAMTPATDPRGRPVYWVGPAGSESDASEGTDFHAIRNGLVSVTPLQVDLTRHASLATVGNWLQGASAADE